MSAGLDILSAISTVISIMDAAIHSMKALHDARERQLGLSTVLSKHYEELRNINRILAIVKEEKALQVATMIEDLNQLAFHGQDLHTSLHGLGKERGQIKQYTKQLLNGKKSLDDLAEIMDRMSRVKANLTIKIQVVHIGLTRAVGDLVFVNCELVDRLDQKLQKLLGQGKGLKLAELVQQKQRHPDGTVHLTGSDIASLSDSESTSDDGGKDTSRIVDRNEADDQALQLNAPVGIGGFVEVDHLVITNNKAIKQAIQVNHAVSQDNFDKILAARLRAL